MNDQQQQLQMKLKERGLDLSAFADASEEDAALAAEYDQYLTFRVGEGVYAIDILETHEILKPVTVTRLPNALPEIVGVMNLRGNIIPVIDLLQKFHGRYAILDDATRIIVANHRGRYHGFIVQRVQEVARVHQDRLEGAEMNHVSHRHVRAVGRTGDRIFLILNLETLFRKPTGEEAEAE